MSGVTACHKMALTMFSWVVSACWYCQHSVINPRTHFQTASQCLFKQQLNDVNKEFNNMIAQGWQGLRHGAWWTDSRIKIVVPWELFNFVLSLLQNPATNTLLALLTVQKWKGCENYLRRGGDLHADISTRVTRMLWSILLAEISFYELVKLYEVPSVENIQGEILEEGLEGTKYQECGSLITVLIKPQ